MKKTFNESVIHLLSTDAKLLVMGEVASPETVTISTDSETTEIELASKAGSLLVRQVFEVHTEKMLSVESQTCKPHGKQTCKQGVCTEVVNVWDMLTTAPLILKNPDYKCTDSYAGSCSAGTAKITQLSPQHVQMETRVRTNGGAFHGHSKYTFTADKCIRTTQYEKYVTPSQDIYYSQNFFVEISNGVSETELVGYHKDYGPFLIDPLNFANDYGLKLVDVVDHPGGKRVTFLVEMPADQ